MRKEKWGKPKLIVLTKVKPEEAVLTACKLGSGEGGGSIADAYGCAFWFDIPGEPAHCTPCWGVLYS
ncbi:MAG: hypothetical protein COX40_01215 [Candidatus Omnitrophica bacterium CG23_combo_of_CG06-09_8_20_14_all_40_11]|nr:MAG: hypothetical protein COX40_01215 [Candidatus Omnitrophica bacterium CG23_combo_of_CG06-09_8_20_14_all_40_11]